MTEVIVSPPSLLESNIHTHPKEKKAEEYRNYVDSKRQDIVTQTYRLHHVNQTYDFVQKMKKKASYLHKRQNEYLGGSRKIRYFGR